ncbi:restriction endonuclease [Thiotrichales bacterium 19S9-12]|nr:restriction endonuclease [Thiotrichales bacterium 19S9-11]MCF6811663.1 restriction endonuclease [Thiotrichales bacterium 19S9-12]
MHNDGTDYELFVAKLQEALLRSDEYYSNKNINVEVRKRLKDKCGNFREFDIYWEFELGGIIYKNVIECKDYNKKISVEKIDAFIGKLSDMSEDLTGIFATRVGYQLGAIRKAEHHKGKINLLRVREAAEFDWVDLKGNNLVRSMTINSIMLLPARIINFTPKCDFAWYRKHININAKVRDVMQVSGENKEIKINDLENSKKYSLYDLQLILHDEHKKNDYGQFIKEQSFNDAFITFEDFEVKINSYTVEYELFEPLRVTTTINYENELAGVIEYLSDKKQKFIYKNQIMG